MLSITFRALFCPKLEELFGITLKLLILLKHTKASSQSLYSNRMNEAFKKTTSSIRVGSNNCHPKL